MTNGIRNENRVCGDSRSCLLLGLIVLVLKASAFHRTPPAQPKGRSPIRLPPPFPGHGDRHEGDTGFSTQVVASADGDFRVLQLPVGRYAVTIDAPGFATLVREAIDSPHGSYPQGKFGLPLQRTSPVPAAYVPA